jgi:predicted transcriptional regulator YheO
MTAQYIINDLNVIHIFYHLANILVANWHRLLEKQLSSYHGKQNLQNKKIVKFLLPISKTGVFKIKKVITVYSRTLQVVLS